MSAEPVAGMPLTTEEMRRRIVFLLELGRRLHQYGTTSPRLEMAIVGAAQALGVVADVWSSPTAIIMSFADAANGDGGIAQTTQVMRMPPGEVNLARLCEADAIADRVTGGELDLHEGFRHLRALGQPESRRAQAAMILSYGLSAASIAALFLHSAWPDLLVAGGIGLVIGWITMLSGSRPRLAVASDLISAVVATTVATVVSAFVVPLAIKSVVLSGLIILIPGMSLTTAVREISTQHLVSGMARLGGAMSTLLKLTFGTVAAAQVCAAVGIHARDYALPPLPAWTDFPALLVGAFAFAILFRAAWRDYPVVIAAVIMGYFATRWGGQMSGSLPSAPFGVFVGALLVGGASNFYARFAHRPGAVIREPGILLLVPGSVGFRSMSFLMEHDTPLGLSTALLLLTLLVSIVAGLMFGDLLVSARRSL